MRTSINISREGNGTLLQYSCLEKSHGWRSLVGYSPRGCEESDMTERLHFHFSLSCTGEGNGSPLPYSCWRDNNTFNFEVLNLRNPWDSLGEDIQLAVEYKDLEIRTWKQPRCSSADEWIGKLWYIYTMEYYSAIKKNSFESVLMRWMKLEPIRKSEVSQKDKDHYSILTHIYGI